jgi:hypothetical protein
MSGSSEASVTRKLIAYLYDRNRILQGGWVSVADIRGALGADLEDVRSACLTLHQRNIAELMGGFPIQPTTDRFTLVRLNDQGTRVATDPGELDRIFGAGDSG